MQLEITTPDVTMFSGEVSLVQVPGLDGKFEMLNNHAPLISVLKQGQVKIIDHEKQTRFFDIRGGVIEVLDNKVIILAD